MKKLPRILLPLLLVVAITVSTLVVFLTWGESTAPDALAVDPATGYLAVAYFDDSRDTSVIDVYDAAGKRLTTVVPNYKESVIPVVHFDANGNLRFYLPIEGHYYTVTMYGDILSYYTADTVDAAPYAYTTLWTLEDGVYTTTAATGATYSYTPTDLLDRMANRRDTVILRDDTGGEIAIWTSAK